MAKIFSCALSGLSPRTIEVQSDISNGLPSFNVVGLGDASVQESRERIRSSIKNSGLQFPQTRKTVNLAPAQIRKQGALFDLPIAISLLAASGQIPAPRDSLIVGELALDGRVKAINGTLVITQHAKEQGFKNIFLPIDNLAEAQNIPDIRIFPIQSLAQLCQFLKGNQKIKSIKGNLENLKKLAQSVGFSPAPEIIGLEKEKRALQIALAGHHNILLSGQPGCGKTVVARSAHHLLPPMTPTQILESTKIYSISGLSDPKTPLILKRPFREVHHTASTTSIVGGGNSQPTPGEISLAHNGVLFLDEIAEFRKAALEALRQPLEDRLIHITRSSFTATFPANFILLATMNPCPCGYHSPDQTTQKPKCKCNSHQVKTYQNRISGPLLDRFDIFVKVEKSPFKVFQKTNPTQHHTLQKSLHQAAQIQQSRGTQNANLTLPQIQTHCRLDKKSQKTLDQATQNLNLSNRALLRTLKVARTIADLDASPHITENHLGEALQFRSQLA